MNFQQVPEIFELLKTENLTPLKVNGENLICTDGSGSKFLMKECRGTEEHVYSSVFPAIDGMGLQFGLLELPKYKKVTTQMINGRNVKFIFLNFYDGKHFNDVWNEVSPKGYGGRAIDVVFSDKVVTLLEDFAKINTTQLSSFNLPTFNFVNWRTYNFPFKTQKLVENNVLTRDHVQKLQTVINSATAFQNSQTIFTNGDFYPRNLIELPTGKIVVIDWEGRLDYEIEVNNNGKTQKYPGQRNTLINYLENHLAFFFVHMWGNYAIQRKILKSASQKFHLRKEDLQVALIIKSLEQAFAFGGGYLAVRLAEIAINATNLDYIDDLLR